MDLASRKIQPNSWKDGKKSPDTLQLDTCHHSNINSLIIEEILELDQKEGFSIFALPRLDL